VELGNFNGRGNCVACHQVNQKVIGPSLQDIAKIYKDKNADMVSFLKGEGEPS
jgi:cytochrome c